MTEENKTEQKAEKKEEKAPKGPRGDIGQATPGLTLKQQWHQEFFTLENTANRAFPYRKTWVAKPGAISLKAYARKLLKEGDALAKSWFANKLGKNNQKRSEKNATEAKLAGAATKTAKRKKKGEGGGGK